MSYAYAIEKDAADNAYGIEQASGDFKITMAADYSTGKYGLDKSTDILYIPLEIKYRTLPWQFSATLPYLRIKGPGGLVGGGGGGVIPVAGGGSSDGGTGSGSASGTSQRSSNGAGNGPGNGPGQGPGPGPGEQGNKKVVTEEGLGDILLETTFSLDMVQDLPFYADLGVILKLPAADEDKGLGTGEFDFALQVDVAKIYYLANQIETTPFVTVGYRFMGDPDDIDFDDVWYSSLGVDLKLSAATHVGFSYDYRQAITPGSAFVSEALLYYDYSYDKNWSVSAYGMAGFENGSPDQAIGLQLKYVPD